MIIPMKERAAKTSLLLHIFLLTSFEIINSHFSTFIFFLLMISVAILVQTLGTTCQLLLVFKTLCSKPMIEYCAVHIALYIHCTVLRYHIWFKWFIGHMTLGEENH